jgi:hypothetical protein
VIDMHRKRLAARIHGATRVVMNVGYVLIEEMRQYPFIVAWA